MDRLWAPWRITYVAQERERGCVFCRIFKERKDKKNFVIFRGKFWYSVLNLFPYNNGHTMIVLNRHVGDLEKLEEYELTEMMKLTQMLLQKMKEVFKPDGFNIGFNIGKVAGAGIEKHIHLHIVPRWRGDTNFMPVVSNTKVISQSLKDAYQYLKNVYEKGYPGMGRKKSFPSCDEI